MSTLPRLTMLLLGEFVATPTFRDRMLALGLRVANHCQSGGASSAYSPRLKATVPARAISRALLFSAIVRGSSQIGLMAQVVVEDKFCEFRAFLDNRVL